MAATVEALRPGASKDAIHRHYDVGNDFYRLWLDPTLSYSCPMWEGNESLEEAQLKKYDYHIAESRAKDKARVIDVGCGWGSQLKRLVEKAGVAEAVGLTLSENQAQYIKSLGLPNVAVNVESWADHEPAQPYGAAISIGAFEHFAKYGVSQKEKIAGYRHFFEKMHALLEPGAHFSLQTMAYGRIARDAVHKDLFIATEIFPESDFPRLADIAEASEMRFEIERVRNDRMHYARTYRAWFDALRAHEAQVKEVAGEDVFKRYERYLRTFSYSFEIGAFELLRVTLRRIDPLYKH
jgi:cyclopropane-fatty-acyl-phospholipid synthase